MTTNLQATTLSLCARRFELEQRLQQLNRDAHRADGPLPHDFADQATLCENDEVVDRLRATTAFELDRIETALSRIAAGNYGRCEDCGRKIESQRLRVLPDTELCLSCALKAPTES